LPGAALVRTRETETSDFPPSDQASRTGSPRPRLCALALALQISAASHVVLAQPAPPDAKSAAQPEPAPASQDSEARRRKEYHFEAGDICPFCALTPEHPGGQVGLHWHDHWAAVGVREYVTVPVLLATALGTQLFIEPEHGPDWNSPILFDNAARNLLRLDSPGARKTARTLSDVLLGVSYAQPYLLDALVVTWWVRRAPRVAWQMFVINSQAYALTFALNAVSKRLTSRARPWVDNCERDPTGESCGTGGAYSSFYSGHAATTATGAGLVCAHHTQLNLYGNPILDTSACVAAVLGTAVTGAMRIAADNHWASDVIVGHLMGYLSGYLLPTLLYYKEFRVSPDDHAPEPNGPTFAVLPMVTGSSAGAGLFGSF
jgi:membrane-associated phospholipid phosphatase